MGPVGQRTPHVIDKKQSGGAIRCGRGQSSPTANSPAVTSSHDDLLDFAHRLSYVGGLLVGASGYGGYNGGTAGRNDGATSEEAMVTQINAWTSISGLQGSYCSCYRGLRWSGWAWPRRRRVAEELQRALAWRWRLPNAVSGHGRRQGVAEVVMKCCGGDGVARH